MEATLFGRSVRIGWPQVVLTGLVLFAAVAVVTAGVTATAPFATYNADWTGTSDLRHLADSGDRTVIVSPNGSAPGPAYGNETVMLIVGTPANTSMTQQTAQQVVAQGGTVVIADDVETPSNNLLRAIGASARIQRGPLRDPKSFAEGPTLPLAAPTTEEEAANVSEFTLNHAGVVEPNGATILAQTSEFAYVDRNRNKQFDQRESLGRRPVLTTEPVADGEVVVLSDSSVFVNAMLDREENAALAGTLLSGADTVILVSATPRPLPPLTNALLVARRSPLLQAVLVTGLLGGLFAVSRGARWRRDADAGMSTADASAAAKSPATAADRPTTTEGFIQLFADENAEHNRNRLRRVVQAAVTDESMDNGHLTTENLEDE